MPIDSACNTVCRQRTKNSSFHGGIVAESGICQARTTMFSGVESHMKTTPLFGLTHLTSTPASLVRCSCTSSHRCRLHSPRPSCGSHHSPNTLSGRQILQHHVRLDFASGHRLDKVSVVWRLTPPTPDRCRFGGSAKLLLSRMYSTRSQRFVCSGGVVHPVNVSKPVNPLL